jgi:serine/threonine protein kinase
MGNQPSQRSGKDDRENTDNDKGDDCQPPCLAWLPSLARTQDPMGSPLPETPLVTRQRRKHVADALRQENKNNHHGMAVPPVSLGSLLPPRANGTASGRTYLEPEANIHQPPPPQQAPVHEGPHAEALLLQTYELLDVLGVGSTSTVQKCRHRETNQVYACKIIDITQMEERFQGMMAQFQTEISALRQLHHAAIIRLLDVYQTPAKIYIVMECMEGGELFDYVVQKGTLTEEEASQIVRKVTSALVYMHAQNIVHRDLKPENLLLKRKPVAGDRSIDVKIIDFGLSKVRCVPAWLSVRCGPCGVALPMEREWK